GFPLGPPVEDLQSGQNYGTFRSDASASILELGCRLRCRFGWNAPLRPVCALDRRATLQLGDELHPVRGADRATLGGRRRAESAAAFERLGAGRRRGPAAADPAGG